MVQPPASHRANLIKAGIVALAGGTLGKPLGYMIGWKTDEDHATEIGEALTGAFAYTGVSLAAIMVI